MHGAIHLLPQYIFMAGPTLPLPFYFYKPFTKGVGRKRERERHGNEGRMEPRKNEGKRGKKEKIKLKSRSFC
jgi:hypothetical protein